MFGSLFKGHQTVGRVDEEVAFYRHVLEAPNIKDRSAMLKDREIVDEAIRRLSVEERIAVLEAFLDGARITFDSLSGPQRAVYAKPQAVRPSPPPNGKITVQGVLDATGNDAVVYWGTDIGGRKFVLKDTPVNGRFYKIVQEKCGLHENVVQYHGMRPVEYQGKKFNATVIDYVDGKSLKEFKTLLEESDLTEEEKANVIQYIATCVIRGGQHIAKANVLHKDFHMGNIRLQIGVGEVKILDLGKSQEKPHPPFEDWKAAEPPDSNSPFIHIYKQDVAAICRVITGFFNAGDVVTRRVQTSMRRLTARGNPLSKIPKGPLDMEFLEDRSLDDKMAKELILGVLSGRRRHPKALPPPLPKAEASIRPDIDAPEIRALASRVDNFLEQVDKERVEVKAKSVFENLGKFKLSYRSEESRLPPGITTLTQLDWEQRERFEELKKRTRNNEEEIEFLALAEKQKQLDRLAQIKQQLEGCYAELSQTAAGEISKHLTEIEGVNESPLTLLQELDNAFIEHPTSSVIREKRLMLLETLPNTLKVLRLPAGWGDHRPDRINEARLKTSTPEGKTPAGKMRLTQLMPLLETRRLSLLKRRDQALQDAMRNKAVVVDLKSRLDLLFDGIHDTPQVNNLRSTLTSERLMLEGYMRRVEDRAGEVELRSIENDLKHCAQLNAQLGKEIAALTAQDLAARKAWEQCSYDLSAELDWVTVQLAMLPQQQILSTRTPRDPELVSVEKTLQAQQREMQQLLQQRPSVLAGVVMEKYLQAQKTRQRDDIEPRLERLEAREKRMQALVRKLRAEVQSLDAQRNSLNGLPITHGPSKEERKSWERVVDKQRTTAQQLLSRLERRHGAQPASLTDAALEQIEKALQAQRRTQRDSNQADRINQLPQEAQQERQQELQRLTQLRQALNTAADDVAAQIALLEPLWKRGGIYHGPLNAPLEALREQRESIKRMSERTARPLSEKMIGALESSLQEMNAQRHAQSATITPVAQNLQTQAQAEDDAIIGQFLRDMDPPAPPPPGPPPIAMPPIVAPPVMPPIALQWNADPNPATEVANIKREIRNGRATQPPVSAPRAFANVRYVGNALNPGDDSRTMYFAEYRAGSQFPCVYPVPYSWQGGIVQAEGRLKRPFNEGEIVNFSARKRDWLDRKTDKLKQAFGKKGP